MVVAKKSNLVLVGMPGCGKSTVGVLLAKTLGMEFCDADLVIQTREGKLLQDILDSDGLAAFLRCEERVLLSLRPKNTVIATGGSAVLSSAAMAHLKDIATVVYIDVPFGEIKRRLGDYAKRGIACEKGQSLEDIYAYRTPLYKQYADIVVRGGDVNPAKALLRIKEALGR